MRSAPVTSSQSGPHPALSRIIERHRTAPYRKPPADYSRAAFAQFMSTWDGRAPLILDACCGTGESSFELARRDPRALVVGVDQSAHRLARRKPGAAPANALLLRAEMADFWVLLDAARIRLHAHYMLYPNPWPKPAQVMRRWPAHPVFPLLLRLGGQLECRSNWHVYVTEFAQGVEALTGHPACVSRFAPDAALTPFERKYLASGHRLWRATVRLP